MQSQITDQNRGLEVLLGPLVTLHDLGGVQVIDTIAFDRRVVSHHYGKRVGYYYQAVNTTPFVDGTNSVILDIFV